MNLARVRALLGRLRVDGRLPPSVAAELRGATLDTVRPILNTARARVRPVIGTGPLAARSGGRRWAVQGRMRQSAFEAGIAQAATVADVLASASVEYFLVTHADLGVVLGLELSDRSAAARALAGDSRTSWWAIEIRVGPIWRSGTVSKLATALGEASEWRVFEPLAYGETILTDKVATTVSFWDLGTSGMLERVGVRGQARIPVDASPTVEDLEGRRFVGSDALPVTNTVERSHMAVDAVFTWVDDQDPVWRENYERARGVDVGVDQCAPIDADVAGRFANHDELRYSLRAAYYNCGWIRHFYLVTAGQRPAWFVEHPRISLVDHRDILDESVLPTFNSHTIESALHHIDGLQEHFLYFNDDVFIGHPLARSEFFEPGGIPRVFVSDARVPSPSSWAERSIDQAALVGRALVFDSLGLVPMFKPEHAPFALRRSLLNEIEERFGDVLEATRQTRFRSAANLSLAASFAGVWGIATGQAVPVHADVRYFNLESGRLDLHLRRLEHGPRPAMFCVNSTEQLGSDAESAVARTMAVLARMFPEPAPWESDG